MDRSTLVVAAAVILASATGVHAFHPSTTTTTSTSTLAGFREKTSLHAVPPMIIGPMIRKMREKNAKKNAPLATDTEAKKQAPGLRVGGESWKWPPVWPYDDEMFTPEEDIAKTEPKSQLEGMAGMLQGMPDIPTPDEIEEEEIERLDVLKYWGEEMADVKTELDPESKEKITNHYKFYLKPGMSILELGAAEESYLPEDMEFSRVVGVGANPKAMDQNPALTEKLVVDLNKVVPERDVDSDELRQLAAEPFDAIIMANTIDFLTNPREVYRSAWYLLKPGGIMIVPFASTKVDYSKKFSRAQVKMWSTFNDDQHMWVAGSFYQFSAGDGWENLLGFDASPESAKKALQNNGPLDIFKQGKNNNVYIVQANKGVQAEQIEEGRVEETISSKMWMLPTMEDRDKRLVAPRLARLYEKSSKPETKDAISDNVSTLPVIYESLIKMDQFAFTFSMQSQLAADLVAEESFTGNDEQLQALKEGLGLRTPGPTFWEPVGMSTADMVIEDKVNLLAHLVPRFGSGDKEQEAALDAFATGLSPTFAVIREKCPDLPESDVQLLGTELLCSEILIPGRSTKEEFSAWVGAMSDSELMGVLSARRNSNEISKTDMAAFQEARAAEERRLEELRRKYQEQVEEARKSRTMAFNPASGKFEEIKKETKK